MLEDLWPGTEEAKCFLQQHRPRGHSGGGAWQHVQTAPQTQSPGDLRPAALPEERTAAVVSRSMGRGGTKATLTLFPSGFSIWRRSLTQSFESQKLLKLFIFFLHAESNTQQSHIISYYFMSFVETKSKISINKNPSEPPQRGMSGAKTERDRRFVLLDLSKMQQL